MKALLTGNVRFIDKDNYTFDLNIIRNADVIWIQTNAISHKQYYRVVDHARLWKIPVRYFAASSAAKCAEQLVESD